MAVSRGLTVWKRVYKIYIWTAVERLKDMTDYYGCASNSSNCKNEAWRNIQIWTGFQPTMLRYQISTMIFHFLESFSAIEYMFHIFSFILPKIEIYNGVNTILGPRRIWSQKPRTAPWNFKTSEGQ